MIENEGRLLFLSFAEYQMQDPCSSLEELLRWQFVSCEQAVKLTLRTHEFSRGVGSVGHVTFPKMN